VGFRDHDLPRYFASLLIASGLDVKVVQTRLRHASAMTTLNTYGHHVAQRRRALTSSSGGRSGCSQGLVKD
jgi:integrase